MSNKCSVINEQVVVIFMTSLFTMATVQPVKTPFIFALSAYYSKTSRLVIRIFSVLNNDQHKTFCKVIHQSIPTVPIPPPPPGLTPGH